jgi:hypothetical protein
MLVPCTILSAIIIIIIMMMMMMMMLWTQELFEWDLHDVNGMEGAAAAYLDVPDDDDDDVSWSLNATESNGMVIWMMMMKKHSTSHNVDYDNFGDDDVSSDDGTEHDGG